MDTRISVIEEGKKIPLISVLNYIGLSVNMHKKAICPFHSDTRPSLSIWEEKNIFKCFVCGETGDVITFWNKYNNIGDYFIAAADLCYTFNIICLSDYNNILEWKQKKMPSKKEASESINNSNFNNKTDYFSVLQQMETRNKELNIASDTVLNDIYNVFINTVVDFYGKKISKKHKSHLINDRFMREEEIYKEGYFTFPNDYKNDFMDVFIEKLDANNIDVELLKKVPGFYYDKKLNEYSFVNKESLGIPIRNIDSLIVRIQLRLDFEVGSNKYGWFASSFASNESAEFKWGTGSGSIATAFIPENSKSKSIIITEGHFKAKKISEEKNCISISVQGVSNWKSIIPVFENIIKRFDIKHVFIAFDSDFKYNSSVFNYAKLLSKCLSDMNYDLHYLIWKCLYGKGIDDVINNGFIDKIEKIDKAELETKVELIYYILDLMTQQVKLDDEKIGVYFECLEGYSKESLNLFINYINEFNSIHPEIEHIFK